MEVTLEPLIFAVIAVLTTLLKKKINHPLSNFREWLNKGESKITNIIYIVLCYTLISFAFYINDVFQKYVMGLPLKETSFGEYPFSGSYLILFSWLFFGAPLFLLLYFLGISIIIAAIIFALSSRYAASSGKTLDTWTGKIIWMK